MSGYQTGKENQLTSDGIYTDTYDANGNLTKQVRISDGQATDYTFDYRNRMTEAVVKTSTGTVLEDEKLTYDVNNDRIGVMLNGVQQLWTVYDRGHPYLDFNGSGQLTQRYILDPTGTLPLVGRISASGSVAWYLTDNLGSVRSLVGGTGNVVDQLAYDAYGNVVSETAPSSGDRFKYAGGEYDGVTGLYQFGARYYSPSDGRFISQDPLSFDAGDTDLYGYVFNAPTDGSDPSGMDPSGYVPGGPNSVLTLSMAQATNIFAGRLSADQQSEAVALYQSQGAQLGVSGVIESIVGRPSAADPTDWFKSMSDFAAGAGDTVSLGLTKKFRQWAGYDDVVDYSSGAYRYGTYAGTGINLALAGAGGYGAITGVRSVMSGLGAARLAGMPGVILVGGEGALAASQAVPAAIWGSAGILHMAANPPNSGSTPPNPTWRLARNEFPGLSC